MFEVVRPTDPGYDSLNSLESVANGPRRYDYESLAEAYNEAPVESIFVLDLGERSKPSNVGYVLNNRGLKVGLDCVVSKPTRDLRGSLITQDKRQITLKKLSSALMKRLDETGRLAG